MNDARTPTTGGRIIKFCIWTLRHQTLIAQQIRIFIWGGTLLILFLALSGHISLDAALHSIVISLVSISLLIWLLIMARRKSLLNVRDPELRKFAHTALLDYICQRRLTAWEKALLREKFGQRYCDLGHC